jgi:hypothetical protein
MESVKECLAIVERRLETAREMATTPYRADQRASVILIADAAQLLRKVVEAITEKQGLSDLGVPR